MALIHCNQLQLPIKFVKAQTVASCEHFMSLGKFHKNLAILVSYVPVTDGSNTCYPAVLQDWHYSPNLMEEESEYQRS